MRMSRLLALLLAIAALGPGASPAQTWPTRPVRIVVPFPPGGTGDVLGRLAARELQTALGQPVVVENRPGAGGAIGSETVARSDPDGYMLVLSNIASQAIGPAVNPKTPYDPLKDFTHVGLIAAVPSGIVVAATSPYASLAPGLRVVSSNLCLAWLLERSAGGAQPLARWLAADAPWRGRLAS